MREESKGYTGIQDKYGGIVLNYTGYVDLPAFVQVFRDYFIHKGIYQSEVFDSKQLSIGEESVLYKDFSAKKVIFSQGPKENSFWSRLPYRNVRGELFDMECGI